jgi:hypothetical protein
MLPAFRDIHCLKNSSSTKSKIHLQQFPGFEGANSGISCLSTEELGLAGS